MAFFARLIPTAIQGAGWLIKNSGNFVDVYNSVKKVIDNKSIEIPEGSTLEEVLLAEIAGFGGFFPALSKGLQVAEGLLGRLVGGLFSAADEEDITGLALGQTPIDLAALWPNPDTTSGKSVPAISGDINKHLAAHGIPTTFAQGESTANLGDHIAQELFKLKVKPGQAPAKQKLAPINLGDQGRLRAAVAAYPIPLGNKGYNSWHSYIRLYHDKFNDKKPSGVGYAPLALQKSLAAERKPYNNTTIQATFNGVVGAEKFIRDVINELPKKEYIVSFDPAEAGNVITFQVETPITIGPGQVQSTVATTAGKVLDSQGGADLPALPDFAITNNQVLDPEHSPFSDA